MMTPHTSSVVFSEPANFQQGSKFNEHNSCITLSAFFRGSLCETLARKGRAQHFSRGEFVYQLWDPARSVFLLRRGLIKTVVSSSTGRELITQIYKPGDIFGELCFCSGTRRENAVAMEESECVEIPFDDLVTHLQQSRQALTDFLVTICDRLASAYWERSSLAFERTEDRLARALLKLAKQLGEASAEGKIIGHYIRQDEIAAMIGAPRETVSSMLKQFRQKHLVSYSRRGHLTVDTTALLAYLRSESRKK